MKKVLSIILATAMLLSMASVAYAANFTDVDANYSWAAEAIDTLSESGVITGYDDGTFKPGKSITRQEMITLLSKATGASAESNLAIVDFAYSLHESKLESCADSYAVKQGAYLIYRGVLSVEEVIDYLCVDNRNLELKRIEAAILIAKALDAEEWFENNKGVDMTVSYDDAAQIPEDYSKYVFYTTSLGIMGEMGNNQFGPKASVTRAQIAVMMKRIADNMEYEFVGGTITDVDTLNSNLVVKTTDGKISKFNIDKSDVIYRNAYRVSLDKLQIGAEVSLILSKGDIYEVNAITHQIDEVFSGTYKGKNSDDAGTVIQIADITKEGQPVSEFKLATDAVIFCKGEIVESIDSISTDDYVTVEIADGLAVRVIAEMVNEVITDLKITNVEGDDNSIVITTVNTNNAEVKYRVHDNVKIMKNTETASISDVINVDKIAITLEYGVVTVIEATSIASKAEGVIEEITISSATSYITIAKDGTKSKYAIARDCSVLADGAKGTIYDLRLGAYAKLKTESGTVVDISAEEVESALQVTGTIKSVSISQGLVTIEVNDNKGNIVEKQILILDTTKILDSTTREILAIKDLKAGGVITAAGTEKLGVYEANAIMILQW